MNKHTFKRGDRVFGQVCTGAVKVPGVFVKKGGCKGDGCIIRRDDGMSGVEPGLYWFFDYLTTHDTNLQVGDWVRYEAIEPYAEGYDTEDGKVGQITHLGQEFATIKGELNQDRFISNLVKIQPPQEAQVKTVKIKHEKYGVVEGVSVIREASTWHHMDKGRSIYYQASDGWSQVPEVEWVTIQVEKEGFSKLKMYENLYGYSDAAYNKYHEYTKWRYPQ